MATGLRFFSKLRSWQAWAGLLSVVYLITAWAGWGRTLIGTEVWALYYAGRSFAEQMAAIREDLVHPPLIYMIERGWLTLFGYTDNTAKCLPLVISVPAIALFTLLAHRVLVRWRSASLLFAGAFVTVGRAPSIVRMYGLGLLLSVAAMLLWDEWRKEPGRRRLLAWSAVMVLLIYTHFFGLLLLAGFVAANWLCGPKRRMFTVYAAAVGLTYVPWLLYVLPVYQSRGVDANLWWVRPLFHNPLLALGRLPASFLGDFGPASWGRWLILSAVLLHLALFAAAWKSIRGFWRPATTSGAGQWFWASLTLFVIPVCLLFAFSLTVSPALHSRFLLGAIPAYWILVVLLSQFGGRAGRALLYGAIVPWVVLSIASSLEEHARPGVELQRAMAISSRMRPGDLVLCLENCNSFYWEVTRRLGQQSRMEFIHAGLEERPLTTNRRHELQQEARLSVMPPRRLEQISFDNIERLWVIAPGNRVPAKSAEFIASRGFTPAPASCSHSRVVSCFAKIP